MKYREGVDGYGVTVKAFSIDQNEPLQISMIGTSSCADDYHIVRDFSGGYVIEYVLDGSVSVTDGERTFIANKGDAYFLHAGNRHELYPVGNKKLRKIWINFHGEMADFFTKIYGLEKMSYFPKFNILPNIEEIHQVLSNCENIHIAIDKCTQIFLRIFQKMHNEVESSINEKSLCEEIKEYIDNYGGVNISLDDIAQRIHCSKSYLIRAFKKKYAITPYEYIKKRKMELAKVLLVETSQSMVDIAEQLGFCDSHYFSRFFKQSENVSPSEYRKKVQKYN